MYKEDLALNNLQWLICHKTEPYSLFFCNVPFDICALGPTIPKHYYPIMKEDGIFVHRKLYHSTYDLNVIS